MAELEQQIAIQQLQSILKQTASHLERLQHEIESEFDVAPSAVELHSRYIAETYKTFRAQLSLVLDHLPDQASDFVEHLNATFRDLINETRSRTLDPSVQQMKRDEVKEWLRETAHRIRMACDRFQVVAREISGLKRGSADQHAPADVSPPAIAVVWNPEIVDPHDYAQLINALGNLVRANGGLGLKLLHTETQGVLCPEEALL